MTTTVYGAVRFVTSKAGKTGLTVAGMVDVYRITKTTGAVSQVITDGLAIEIGQGMYGYAYGSADTSLYLYLAVFTTADATVDDTQPCVWMADIAEGAAVDVVDGIVDAITAKTANLPGSPAAVGSLMGLSDDAITSAKFDESSAFPLKAADAAATQIARVGADGDTLETLSDAQDTILARLGAWAGTGVNTLLGAFKALLSKAATVPSDIGGTFDPATDSTEAIRDTAPMGTAMRGTDGAELSGAAAAALAAYDPPTKTEMDAGHALLATAANLITVDTVVDAILADTGTDGVALADGSITAAKIAENAIGASELAADAAAEIAAAAWAYAARTLTQTAAEIAATVSGSTITEYRGDIWTIPLTVAAISAARTKLWFMVKADKGETDADALIAIEETAGLQTINRGTAATPTNGSLTVVSAPAGTLTIVLKGVETAKLTPADDLVYDVQELLASGPITLGTGTVAITGDVTRTTG